VSRVRLSLSHRAVEDSPTCLLRLRLALASNGWMMFIWLRVFVFPLSGKFLLLLLLLLFVCHAAIAWRAAVSVFTPMAQMKPSSSRPTAVTILRWSLPAAASLA
jgi:hypothetical protein